MNEQEMWQAFKDRDGRHDGRFVVAVKTTGVFCRPSCPAKRPLFKNVQFYKSAEDALEAGFRPCKRCRPDQDSGSGPSSEFVKTVCSLIEKNEGEPLTLAQLSRRVGLSPSHLQRSFKQALGVSPRQYAEQLRLQRVRKSLRRSNNVADALYDAGFGSPSRLYERSGEHLGMTPATYARGGAGARISYSCTRCRLGILLLAATEKGLCRTALGDDENQMERALRAEFPHAKVERDEKRVAPWLAQIVSAVEGRESELNIPLDIRATAFQRLVWEELRRIPRGRTRAYKEVARAVGRPQAQRAVARACADNPVAVVIPCHRVVRSDGGLGGYGWGVERKRALLAAERRSTNTKQE